MCFILDAFHRFWQQQPALLYAIAGLLGTAFALDWNFVLMAPLFALLLPLFFPSSYKMQGFCLRLISAFLLMICTFFYVSNSYQAASLPQEGVFRH